jgi:DNA processing protein
MDTRETYIALNMIDGIGPIKVRAMIDALGSPEAVFGASVEQLTRVDGVGTLLAERIAAAPAQLDVRGEVRRAERLGMRIVTFPDADYPAPLREIHDPPLALYLRGTLSPRDRHAVAVVGSRRTTHYGRMVADRLAYQLAKVGFTVISGLARGVDTAAHEGALNAGGRTGAVIGSALDRLYPPENAALADRIAGQGFVMSEFHLGVEPGRTTFPMRNRIVSGLSQGVVVVEAGRGSGALITCNQAMEQGRLVFAVPGRIDSPASKGCHDLIKQGARLVDDVDDILDELQYLIPPETAANARMLDNRPDVQLSEQEQAVVKALWAGPRDVDSLSRELGQSPANLGALLIGLEMKRVARMLPGRQVELSRHLQSGA